MTQIRGNTLVRLTPSSVVRLVALCTLCAVTACSSNRAITPDERLKSIDESEASVRKFEEQTRLASDDSAAISVARRLADNDYRIGPDDVLQITVFQVDELSGEYTVSGRGELNMPLIGQVMVSELTAADIENALEVLYSDKYLRNPEITVRVTEYQSQQITVMGEVNVPGMYPLKGQTTLMEALALARGLNRIADLTNVIVFREEESVVYGYLVNVQEVMAGTKPDPDVFGNDRIVVPEDGSASFLRSLQVGVPGFGGYRQY